jgi:hypothetical protein
VKERLRRVFPLPTFIPLFENLPGLQRLHAKSILRTRRAPTVSEYDRTPLNLAQLDTYVVKK